MTHPVEASLEIAAARCADLAPLVYRRLFALHPQMQEMFCLDSDGAVRGSMLSHALRVLLDLLGARHFGPSFVHAESIAHTNYGVPPEMFAAFYVLVRDAVREVAADDWTAAMHDAWEAAIADIAGHVARPEPAGAG